MTTMRNGPPSKPTRVRNRAVREGSHLPEGDLPLPGLEGIRAESRPVPEVAEVPFALTGGQLATPSRRARPPLLIQIGAATRSPERPTAGTPGRRPPLLEVLHAAEKAAVIALPGEGREALVSWFHAQERVHGEERWFVRMAYLIGEGDWDRARDCAVAASGMSIVRACVRATTPEERAALFGLAKRRPSDRGAQNKDLQ